MVDSISPGSYTTTLDAGQTLNTIEMSRIKKRIFEVGASVELGNFLVEYFKGTPSSEANNTFQSTMQEYIKYATGQWLANTGSKVATADIPTVGVTP